MILEDELVKHDLKVVKLLKPISSYFWWDNIYIYYIHWIYPRTQDASHHQDYSIFSKESRTKPLFVTVTGWGVDRIYIYIYTV